MRVLTLILICIVSISFQAQTFEEYISKGDKLYGEESYTKSGKEYDKAFALKEGSASQYYNAACSWALTEDTIQSIKYLQLSAEKGWKNLKHIGRDSDLKSLHNVSAWKGILEEVQVNQDEYEKDFDKPLKEQLEWVNVKDQMLRQLYRDAEEKFGKESEEMKYYWQLVSEQDSLNEIEVFKIIDEKGWVGRNLVGSQANTAIWLVIQHAALEVQEKYLPYLKESVQKGESSGGHLALLEDRIQMRNDKPQTYGTQIILDKETDKKIVFEIFEPEYVNQRRKEVGLGPLEDYISRWGIEWTIAQKEK